KVIVCFNEGRHRAALSQRHDVSIYIYGAYLGAIWSHMAILYGHYRSVPVYFAGTNFNEIELTQCLTFFSVKYSPSNTWPRGPLQLAHNISILLPSASSTRSMAPGISSSKLGHPQCASNLSCDLYKGVSHLLQR